MNRKRIILLLVGLLAVFLGYGAMLYYRVFMQVLVPAAGILF